MVVRSRSQGAAAKAAFSCWASHRAGRAVSMVASARAITRSPKLQETAVTKIIELVRGGPLQRGSKDHDAVRVLQEALKRMGFTLVADGYFGGETETIIEAVQKDHGLKVDGIV